MRIPPIQSAGTPRVTELLDGVEKGLGMVPNLFRTAAQAPSVLEGMVGLFGAVAQGSLGPRFREAIALAVSELNGCDYCLSAHSVLGKGAGLDVSALARARAGTSDEPRLHAALQLAEAVVKERGHIGDAAFAAARVAGLTEGEILEVVANVALTTFTNYLNEVAGTEIDFPVVAHRAASGEGREARTD
jgi:uncharacterized peroxidase-related enzyme